MPPSVIRAFASYWVNESAPGWILWKEADGFGKLFVWNLLSELALGEWGNC